MDRILRSATPQDNAEMVVQGAWMELKYLNAVAESLSLDYRKCTPEERQMIEFEAEKRFAKRYFEQQ